MLNDVSTFFMSALIITMVFLVVFTTPSRDESYKEINSSYETQTPDMECKSIPDMECKSIPR